MPYPGHEVFRKAGDVQKVAYDTLFRVVFRHSDLASCGLFGQGQRGILELMTPMGVIRPRVPPCLCDTLGGNPRSNMQIQLHAHLVSWALLWKDSKYLHDSSCEQGSLNRHFDSGSGAAGRKCEAGRPSCNTCTLRLRALNAKIPSTFATATVNKAARQPQRLTHH